jgi:uncharacterized membrane protein YdfJ with MMPL/SSD domain
MRYLMLLPLLLAANLVRGGQPDENGSYFPQKLTAQDLLYACAASSLTSHGRERQHYCRGFISGVEETIRYYGTGESLVAAYCFPQGMSARNYGDVFIKYASRKGIDTGRPAVVVVQEAFTDAFSCERSGEQAGPR